MDDTKQHEISSLPRHADKVASMYKWLVAEIGAQRLNYTAIFTLRAELQTIAFEILDGITRDANNVPMYRQTEPIDLTEDHHIVVVALPKTGDPLGVGRRIGELYVDGTRMVRQLGKVGLVREDVRHKFGAFAAVDDSYPARNARMMIWRGAWPLRDLSSAACVEWAWLEAERAKAEDQRIHGVDEVHELCMGVTGFKEFLAERDQKSEPGVMTPKTGKQVRA